MGIRYPENMSIPEGPADYYLFAGEAGTSPRFAPGLRKGDGGYRRHVEEAFGRSEWVPGPGSSSKKAPR